MDELEEVRSENVRLVFFIGGEANDSETAKI